MIDLVGGQGRAGRHRREMQRSFLEYSMSVIVRARAAGRARRAEAGAPAHPLRMNELGLAPDQRVQEVREHRR